MTLVNGTVQDLGYDGMEGTLWARPARFRSDGQVVLAPERKPFKITGGVVSAKLAPGPAVLELQVGSHARGTFEVVIPDTDVSLADLLDTVFPWEPAQVSLFVAEREAAQQAKVDAEQAATLAGTAKSDAELAAQQAGQDRAHVDSIRETLDEAAQSNVAPYLTQSELNATYETGAARIVYVSPSGDDARSGRTWSAAKATISAALAAMGSDYGTIILDNGTHNIGPTLAWPAGAKCGLIGQGVGNTVIEAAAQTGPVLDLTGVGYGLNRSRFGNFSLVGDGTAGAAKKGLALSSTVSIVGAYFHDIAVSFTGGCPFDLGMAELTTFDRLHAAEPVDVVAGDVPYLTGVGAFNGNTISRLCLSADVNAAKVGVSGAVVMKDNGSTTPHDNKIVDPQVQGLRLPTDSTIFALAANANIISDIQMFDAGKIAGATGTSVVRLTAPAVLDLGGNLIRGVIPGKGTSSSDIDLGVDLRQSRNRVEGIKGFRGNNVLIAPGVANSYIHLAGAVASATDPAVIDNSGLSNNVSYDGVHRIDRAGEYARDGRGAANGAAGPRFYDPATPANGALWMGQSGTRLMAVGPSLFQVGDTVYQRNVAGTGFPLTYFGPNNSWPGMFVGEGTPAGVISAPPGSIYLNRSGGAGATFFVKESGSGNAGWVAK